MKKAFLFFSLCSVLLFSCKKEEEPDFERGNLLLQMQLEGDSTYQPGVNIKLYIMNLSTPQFVSEQQSNNEGTLGLVQFIAESYKVEATYNDTLPGGAINTYTADTLVNVIPNGDDTVLVVLRP